MNKTLVAAVAAVAIVLAIALLRHSRSASELTSETADSSTIGSDSANDGRSSLLHDRSSNRRDAAAAGDLHPASAGAANDRRSGAAALQERLAAAGGRVAGRNASGARADSADAGESGSVAAEQRAGLRPQNPAKQTDVNTTDPTGSDTPGETAPDFAYNSGLDKSYGLDKRTELTDFDNIGGPTGTVSFWIKPQWQDESMDNATFVQIGDGGLRFAKMGNTLRFEYPDKNGLLQGIGIGLGSLRQDEWHLVIGTWAAGSNELLVDGKPTVMNADALPPDFQSGKALFVGGSGGAAPGQITGVQVSNQASSAGSAAFQYQNNRPH